jgi:uncharacterized protein YjiS (DUF1127 family)
MFSQLKSQFSRWIAYHDTVRQLSALDRRILVDMGFERTTPGAIRDCARQSVREAACL